MGSDILSRIDDTLAALIDGAEPDWLSDDAMRWTPEKPGVRGATADLVIIDEIHHWTPPVMLDLSFFVGAFNDAAKRIARAFGVPASLLALEPALRQLDAARRGRLRRMHHLYRRRRRRW